MVLRLLRLVAWFFVGLLLGGLSVSAFAASIPATATPNQTVYFVGSGPHFSSPMAAAEDWCGQRYGSGVTDYPGYGMVCTTNNQLVPPLGSATETVYSCPSGYTLNGQMCDPISPCPVGSSGTGSKYLGIAKDANSTVGTGGATAYCNGSCVVAPDPGTISCAGFPPAGGPTWPAPAWCTGSGTLTGETCTYSSSNPAPGSSLPASQMPHSPPCAPGEGVLTSSSGTVSCVPAGTPSATPPKTSSSTTTTTNGDGSTATAVKTQICTGDGACQTVITTTTTGVGGGTGPGATPGQAGTPGTSTTQTDKPPSETSDFCAKNPSLQICKGNIATEDTAQKIVKALTPGDGDNPEVSSGSKTAVDDAIDGIKNKVQEITDGGLNMHGVVFSWQAAAPQATCSPWSIPVAGRSIAIDPCPTVAKISEIAGYCMYFMTALTLGWILFGFGRQA